ncbi:MAG: nodulation protein NfeD [Candidatus Nezhaarchaeota archaeon]|nr:nodulation protein NfeD [Candidatus Nezhaarchaeota archaeon]
MVLTFLLITMWLIASNIPRCVGQTTKAVYVLKIEGTITPATALYVDEGLRAASNYGASATVLLLNTPGGLINSMIDILDYIEASPVPVIAYVYPRGARAWSAGTYILVGAHVAAMAPHTLIGSCQPVDFTGQPVNDTKHLNALKALMAEKARERGRNVDVALAFISENLNLGADEAYRTGIIDIPPADDLDEVLRLVDGITVNTIKGPVTLKTEGASIEYYDPSLRVLVLTPISDPQIAYILMTVGMLALIFGLASGTYPSAIVGAIMTMLGVIGLGVTPLSIGSLALIALGMVLLAIEASTPGFGLFGISGIISLAVGGLMIVALEPVRWSVTPDWFGYFIWVVVAVTAPIAAFTIFVAYKVIKIRGRSPAVGSMIGRFAEALDDMECGAEGYVISEGELWMARAAKKVRRGAKVKVVGKEGPRLIVEPVEEHENSEA